MRLQGSYDHVSFIGEKTEILKDQIILWVGLVVRKRQNCNIVHCCEKVSH